MQRDLVSLWHGRLSLSCVEMDGFHENGSQRTANKNNFFSCEVKDFKGQSRKFDRFSSSVNCLRQQVIAPRGIANYGFALVYGEMGMPQDMLSCILCVVLTGS